MQYALFCYDMEHFQAYIDLMLHLVVGFFDKCNTKITQAGSNINASCVQQVKVCRSRWQGSSMTLVMSHLCGFPQGSEKTPVLAIGCQEICGDRQGKKKAVCALDNV